MRKTYSPEKSNFFNQLIDSSLAAFKTGMLEDRGSNPAAGTLSKFNQFLFVIEREVPLAL